MEESVLNNLENGNWTDGAELMKANNISVPEIIEYIETQEELEGYNAYEFFNLRAVYAITKLSELKSSDKSR